MSEIDRKSSLIRLLDGIEGDSPVERLGRRLQQNSTALDEVHVFEKGQMVKWKVGLKNRSYPDYDVPAIVREVLDAPVFDECNEAKCAGNPFFHEPLTIVIGLIHEDDTFLEFRVDGRRFKPLDS